MPCSMSSASVSSRQAAVLRLRAHPLKIALVGNPNVGKSVVFGRLTGRYATVSNYPGTTVAITTGRALIGAEVCDVIDTPGVNTLEGVLSEDERITRQLLSSGGAELIVQVADARNLRRALMLTSQLAATPLPMILVLNMVDEAHARGITIDTEGLAERLGIPVIEAVAIEGRGMADVREPLPAASRVAGTRVAHVSHIEWADALATLFRRTDKVSAGGGPDNNKPAVPEPLTGPPLLPVRRSP